MAKRMRSDAVPLSPEDYKFIMQYRDVKPKTDVLKKPREKYPMTNNRFYKIWRGQEVSMIEWYQPISESITPSSQDLPILKLPSESCSPSIDHTSSTGETSITENSNQINIPNKQVKKRKLRSKSVRISDSPNSGASAKTHIISGADTPNTLTKKVERKDDLYALIKQDRKETEEYERESERFLNRN
ncbi:8473_t:CDS:1 [Acaulospora morrowiae]|uniref:8473_t:CDS:1 n=1 Tax=Acaulospora morrowiae TaxID=94023 RepID=A0A9N9NB73_9GLOM|nr:8473_t:CDS:1 [Acaulospora morrowiae]